MLEFALAENFGTAQLDANNTAWLEALPARVYHTPIYGEVPVTVEKLQRMIKSFKENVRGQEIAVNFDHGADKAKGNKAAGWYKDFAIGVSKDGSPTLKAQVQFTDEAATEIKSGAWKYFSMEWDDLWQDNSGAIHQDVITGGALTNRPVAKGMEALPVNFSETQWKELDEETQKQFAVWSTAYINDLPDSAFLYVEPGAKTKDQRHLPFKDATGKVDLPHLRNAIARIPQMKGLSESVKNRLQAKARSILTAKSKNMSEEVVQRIEDGELILVSEHADWEHSEPGTGAPRTAQELEDPGTGQPVVQPSGDPAKDDPAIGGGWRREPMPPPDITDKGDTALNDEELAQLRKVLELPDDAEAGTIVQAAGVAFSEVKMLRELAGASLEEKKFAEQYPTMHKQMVEDRKKIQTTDAKTFSESVSQIKRQEGESQVGTDKGLSALALEKIMEVHLKFSEGTATRTDFEEAVSTIVNGGIVDFSEKGSSKPANDPVVIKTDTAEGVMQTRKAFAEKVAEVQADPEFKGSYKDALREAGKRNPELAEAYSKANPVIA